MDVKLFQIIVPGVNEIVSNIDAELEAFSLNVNDVGISSLHQITYTLISSIYIEIRKINESSPLINFEKTKEIEKKLFVAKLTSKDEDNDKTLAAKAANNLIRIVEEQVRDEQVLAFNNRIKEYKDFFSVQQITKDVENYILKIASDVNAGKLQNGNSDTILKLLENHKD